MKKTIFTSATLKENDLREIGTRTPNQYYGNLQKRLSNSPLQLSYVSKDIGLLSFVGQKASVFVNGNEYKVAEITNLPDAEKDKTPEGILFKDDYSTLTVRELIAYNVTTKKLYIHDYHYSYRIWKEDLETCMYYFRFDREVTNRSNVKYKSVEHMHVCYKDPHFDSSFVNLDYVMNFIEKNWDSQTQRFKLRGLTP